MSLGLDWLNGSRLNPRSARAVGWAVAALALIALASCFGDGGTIDGQPDGDGDGAPLADLAAFPEGGPAPLGVNLDASGSWASDGGALTFDWDLDGDGTFEVLNGGDVVQHTFDQAGDYVVRVRVTDSQQRSSADSVTVSVTPALETDPVASLFAFPESGVAPAQIGLDASGSWPRIGGSLTYDYDVDSDGTYEYINAADNIVHTYTTPGTYTATVRVTDSADNTATATAAVTITALGA